MAKTFWLLTALIAILSYVSGVSDSQGIWDTLFLVVWCSWGPILFATCYQVMGNDNSLVQYMFASAFVSVAGFALYILSLTTYELLTSGSLKDSGLIFLVVPFGFVKYGLLGNIVGGFIYYVLKFYKR